MEQDVQHALERVVSPKPTRESDLKLLSNFVRATSVVKSTPRRPSRVSRTAVHRHTCTHGTFKEMLPKLRSSARAFSFSLWGLNALTFSLVSNFKTRDYRNAIIINVRDSSNLYMFIFDNYSYI